MELEEIIESIIVLMIKTLKNYLKKYLYHQNEKIFVQNQGRRCSQAKQVVEETEIEMLDAVPTWPVPLPVSKTAIST